MEGIEPVAAEHPKVTFSGDAAGEIGVGGDHWPGTDSGQLECSTAAAAAVGASPILALEIGVPIGVDHHPLIIGIA
jgi:hypothetical protein